VATRTIGINELPLLENISIYEGNTYRQMWALWRETAPGTSAVSVLTGVTWVLRIYSLPEEGTSKLSKTTTTDWTASGIYVDNAATGQFSVYILAADMAALTPGVWFYEVIATFPVGHPDFPSQVRTLLNGQIAVLNSVA
jgi:hypothetical protein